MTADREPEETPAFQNQASEQVIKETTASQGMASDSQDNKEGGEEASSPDLQPMQEPSLATTTNEASTQQTSAIQPEDSKTTGIDAAFASESSKSVEVTENQPVTNIIDSISVLDQKLAGLHRFFDDNFVDDSFKEAFIKQMHSELQEYKQDIVGQKLKPLLTSVIQLHTETSRTYERLTKKKVDELSTTKLLGVVEGIQDDVEILLAQHGIEPFVESGEFISPDTQKAVQTWKVEDSSLFGKIVARRGPGFKMGKTILRKEPVEVYAGFTAPDREGAGPVSGGISSEIEAQQSQPAGEDS